MKVDRIVTLRLEEFPNLLLLRIHTDDGVIGLGETYFGAEAVETYVHETVAPYLLGEDPRDIDRHWGALYGYIGFDAAGVETRGNSAVDIALWDLLGRATGQPVYRLLGGRTRDRIPVYNTCAGYNYARRGGQSAVDNWGLPAGESPGPYEDLDAFLNRPAELAQSLLDEGITGMKIWPFDPAAKASGGKHIGAAEMNEALRPFRAIRDAVGSRIDIMVELHALWNLPTARRIARTLEEFDPYWYEDPMKADDISALAELAGSTEVPLALSETLATRQRFKELFEQRAAAVAIFDIGWCGGISEARKIGILAESYQLPVAPHDCTGPLVLAASTHLCMNLPNALVQEIVRAFCQGWYCEIVTDLPPISEGYIMVPERPGLGVDLLPDIERRPDARVRASDRGDL